MHPSYPREDYGALFDAHIHTYFDYHDGTISPQQLIQCTKQRGFNWVLAMAHDTCRGAARIAKLAKDNGLPCISGIEVSTVHNHLLAYGVQTWPYLRNTLSPDEAIEILREQGCAIFLAHPYSNPRRVRQGMWYPEIVKKLDYDGIEWFNATIYTQNAKTHEIYSNIPRGRRIAGTDSHHPSTFGYSFTQVCTTSINPDDLVDAMRKGKCKAYNMHVPLHRTLYSVLASLSQNAIRKRKYIEGRWIKPIGDRPGSIIPDSYQGPLKNKGGKKARELYHERWLRAFFQKIS